MGESSYCEPHHEICHNGHGRDIGLLETMIRNQETTIRHKGTDRSAVVPVDEQIRGRT